MKEGVRLRLIHCEGDGLDTRCDFAKLFVKIRQLDNPAGGKVNQWDKGSEKVARLVMYSDVPFEIIDVNDPRNYHLVKKYDINRVPTLVDVNGVKVEGSEEIISNLKPLIEIRKIEEW